MRCLDVSAIILAAGTASRMGQLKQLLPYAGTTLVGNAINQALEAGLGPVVVVVGAQADAVQTSIAAKPVVIVRNEHWARGMGSSISAGARHLLETENEAAAAAFLAADQPLVTAAHLSAMRQAMIQSGAPIVAAEYGGTCGIPVVFRRDQWRALATIPPQTGAKALLSMPGTQRFSLPEAASDIDTPEDWTRLKP